MDDNYRYIPQQTDFDATDFDATDFDPTAMDTIYPEPTQEYPYQPRYTPPSGPSYYPPMDPMGQNAIGNLPTVQAPTVIQHVYVPVPYPVAAPDTGGGMALTSLILGIMSASVGWIPLCGAVALFPAILGIVFGGLGMKSRRRRGMAMAGMILSMLAIAMALVFFI